MKRKVIVLADQGIGDLIMQRELLQRIAAGADVIECLVIIKSRADVEVLALLGMNLERVGIVCARFHERGLSLVRGAFSIVMAARKMRGAVLCLPFGFNAWKARMLKVIFRPSCVIGPARIAIRDVVVRPVSDDSNGAGCIHREEYAKQVLTELSHVCGLDLKGRRSDVANSPSEGAQRQALDLPRKIIIAPGSGPIEKHKRLPVRQVAEVILLLLESDPDASIVLVGGEAEREHNEKVLAAIPRPDRVKDLTGLTSLHELQNEIRGAACVWSACNGISHLAGFLGVPGVVVFGPTNPRVTGARSRNIDWIVSTAPCAPCYRRDLRGGCTSPSCMEHDAMDVFVAIQRALNRQKLLLANS